MYAGIDPCHTAGTDITPTSRAVPKPADATPKAPSPAPLIGCCSSYTLLPAICGGGSTGGVVAPTNIGEPCAALWAAAIIGDISALAGYIPACATVVNVATGVEISDVSGESAPSTDCS